MLPRRLSQSRSVQDAIPLFTSLLTHAVVILVCFATFRVMLASANVEPDSQQAAPEALMYTDSLVLEGGDAFPDGRVCPKLLGGSAEPEASSALSLPDDFGEPFAEHMLPCRDNPNQPD